MDEPPPVLAGLYVVAYAYVDQSVRFVQRNNLSVDGQWLGCVACLAISQDFESADYEVQHCDDSWEPLGIAGGYKTLEEAKTQAELSYNGIASKWIGATATKEVARALYGSDLKAISCSFCGRTPLKVSSMIDGKGVRICNFCIEGFHESLRDEFDRT